MFKEARMSILVLGAVLLLLSTAVPVRGEEACVKKILATCTTCHYQTRICNELGQKSRRGWEVTVDRMLRYGLKLTEQEKDRIIACLLAMEDDSGRLCQ